MGNEDSREAKQERVILRKPQQGEASTFYWACRNGDLQCVQDIFFSTPLADVNRLEPNGSTGLHAAAYFGHLDVVKFLVQHGTFRYRRNLHGLTAYEEAANDEIRALFQRPSGSQRFVTLAIEDDHQVFTLPNAGESEDDDDSDRKPDDWVNGENDELEIRLIQARLNATKKMLRSRMVRSILTILTRDTDEDDEDLITNEEQAVKALQQRIDKCVTPSHPQYKSASALVSKYERSRNVDHLLRLYSLETPFYQSLGKDSADLLLYPILFKLDTLQHRAFQGCSYRGLTMNHDDLRAYRWALKHKGSILQTKSFCSSSIDRDVASVFIRDVSTDKVGVLMVFNFAEKCDTAIQLYAISKDVLGVSQFEDEREVLILPMTYFCVTNIEIDKNSGFHTIYLDNLQTKGGFFTLLKQLWKERRQSMKFNAVEYDFD